MEHTIRISLREHKISQMEHRISLKEHTGGNTKGSGTTHSTQHSTQHERIRNSIIVQIPFSVSRS